MIEIDHVSILKGVIKMQKYAFVFILAGFFAYSIVTVAQTTDMRSKSHPLIGFWESIEPNTGCKETYQFNADGTGEFSSGKEVLKVTYDADAQPNLNGFFKLHHTVESTNGEQDCTKSTSTLHEKQSSFVLFQPDGFSYIACDNDDPSLESCFGPMVLKGKQKPLNP